MRLTSPILLLFTGTALTCAQITYDGATSWDRNSDPGTFDASGSDKLVVIVSGEHNFPDNPSGDVTGITYNGQTLIKAVEESPDIGAHGQTTSDIWYLDSPASYPGVGTIDVSFTGNNWVVTAITLSGTDPGVGNTAHVSSTSAVNLSTSAPNSMVIAAVGMGGMGNTASPLPGVTANAPLDDSIPGLKIGSSWAGHAVGYEVIAAPGPQIYSFNTTKTDVVTVAAEFTAPSTEVPTNPAPAYGILVPGGSIDLTWTNLPPNTGPHVWVDVYFGTDPGALTQVVDASSDAANRELATVTAPLADTYFWRVDSYLDGAPTGTPLEGSLFHFIVEDGDNDGLPDSYELANTIPPSPTSMDPTADLENSGTGDGLANLQEYQLGTDPLDPDSDGDTLEDGPELTGVGLRPATDPTEFDTDGDGLSDGVESNTGSFVNSGDTGTDPTVADSDGDSLSDGVETGSGSYIDENDTGTHPLLTDSDADGAEEWYEINAAFTDPSDPNDKPNIPYPLPDPVPTDEGSSTKPVQVYILSGQSNMVGFGRVDGTGDDTLETISKTNGRFPNLVDDLSNDWSSRNDVLYRGVIAALGNGPLEPGFGTNSNSFGPELGFGHVMGWYHDAPVLIIKSSQGGRALGWDFVPPGSTSYDRSGTTYAGYGDSPGSWPTGTTPTPDQYYGGYQFDQCFMDEDDWHPAGSAFGAVTNVTDVLDNFATEYEDWAAQGFEIAGFGWFHGWNDGLSFTQAYAENYEQNMAQFIREIRDYYEGRYPLNIASDAPFVIATAAFDGFTSPYPTRVQVAEGQLAVSGDAGNYPEFIGNVKTTEARGYWRTSGPNQSQGYHYFHNAETYMLIGDAMGRAMIDLTSPSVDPQIVSIQSAGGNLLEIQLQGQANTTFKFMSSTTLSFTPGLLVENLTQGDPGDPGTIGGTNNSEVTTDGSGNATVQMDLGSAPANFLRGESIP